MSPNHRRSPRRDVGDSTSGPRPARSPRRLLFRKVQSIILLVNRPAGGHSAAAIGPPKPPVLPQHPPPAESLEPPRRDGDGQVEVARPAEHMQTVRQLQIFH